MYPGRNSFLFLFVKAGVDIHHTLSLTNLKTYVWYISFKILSMLLLHVNGVTMVTEWHDVDIWCHSLCMHNRVLDMLLCAEVPSSERNLCSTGNQPGLSKGASNW